MPTPVILTTGVKSGLGRYLYEELGGLAISRETSIPEFQRLRESGVDVLIHCAANSHFQVTSETVHRYVEDNIFLTQRLLSIPHKKFIFLSSVDVYPHSSHRHDEDEIIDVNLVNTMYGIAKLISEGVIRHSTSNWLILRCSSLLGKYMKKNNLVKIFQEDNCHVTLARDSVLNYVAYFHLLDFIKLAIALDLKGIYNMVSSQNITLGEIADRLKRKVYFENFRYAVGDIDNQKAVALYPPLELTSKEILENYFDPQLKERIFST